MFENLFKPSIESLVKKRDYKGLIKATTNIYDKKYRIQAISALGSYHNLESMNAIIATFYDPDIEIQQYAFTIFKNYGQDLDAVKLIKKLSMDQNENIRIYAKSYLKEVIGSDTSVDSQLVALKDHNKEIRREAVHKLSFIGDAKAKDAIFLALNDQDIEVRDAAKYTLKQLGDERVSDSNYLALYKSEILKTAITEIRRKSGIYSTESIYRDIFRVLGFESIPVITELLADDNFHVMRDAAVALTYPLKGEMKNKNPEELYNALIPTINYLNGIISDAKIIPNNPDCYDGRVSWAVMTLGEIGDQRSESVLKELLEKVNRLIAEQGTCKTFTSAADSGGNRMSGYISINDKVSSIKSAIKGIEKRNYLPVFA